MFGSWRRDASGVGFEVRWSDYYRGGFRVIEGVGVCVVVLLEIWSWGWRVG